ncbi:MAG: cytochrome c3 family protein [Proteobacteria bacterium]|nr:cytochrome c3 family protein [Pseudomonadota bacterium]
MAMNVESKQQMIFFVTRNTVGFLMIGVLILFPVTMNAAVKNTHHDFSNSGLTNNGETCVVCHTPHNANTTVSQSPLWNHQVTVNSYTLYNSSTSDATATQPTSITRLCLSCHDGTVALGSFGENTGTTYMRDQTSRAVPISIGTALYNHHPVAITYDSALASQDGGLYNPDVHPSGLGGTISHDLLNGGVMECSSCHDVHVARGTGNCTDCHDFTYPSYYLNTKSLVKSNVGSALCFTCHKK